MVKIYKKKILNPNLKPKSKFKVSIKEKNPKHRSAYKKENLNQNYKRIKNEVKFKIEATTKIKLKVEFESTYQKKFEVRIEQHHKRKIQS